MATELAHRRSMRAIRAPVLVSGEMPVTVVSGGVCVRHCEGFGHGLRQGGREAGACGGNGVVVLLRFGPSMVHNESLIRRIPQFLMRD